MSPCRATWSSSPDQSKLSDATPKVKLETSSSAVLPPPPGHSVFEQSRWIANDGRLRHIIGNEPRGGVFKHVNLLVPAIDPAADIGFIIMEPMDTPLMSGSNAMCVATVVLETGIVPMTEPTTTLTLEGPGRTRPC